MKKTVILIAKILGGLVVTVIVAAVAILYAVHQPAVQQRLLQRATELLSEHLGTEVKMDSVSVSLVGEDIHLYGLTVLDRQQRQMFQLGELGVDLDLWKLLQRQIRVTEAKVRRLDALLLKPASDSDSVANYQFVLEAFKKHPKDSTEQQPQDSIAQKNRKKMTFDLQKLTLERIHVNYNGQEVSLDYLMVMNNWRGRRVAECLGLQTSFVKQTKKGPVDNTIGIGRLEARENKGHYLVSIDSLYFLTDNHKPRKNVGKPKRGFFDAGHFDVVSKLDIRVERVDKDSLVAAVTRGSLCDRGSGLNVTDLRLHVDTDFKRFHLSNVTIALPHTKLTFASAGIMLPSKKHGRSLSYSTSLITGRTQLRDIARTFAPVLAKFNMPVNLQTYMSGTDNGINFRKVKVFTDKNSLVVSASGRIRELKDKHRLFIRFDVSNMTTTGAEAEHIINQFPVKKFMMKQLNALGRITYKGHFEVLWKKEQFTGKLKTTGGPLDFFFALDEQDKYVYGNAKTSGLQLGRIMDMPDIGNVVSSANFRFDISKPRTAAMRRQRGGKLPIGHVDAQVEEAVYKKIKVHNVFADINSDGAVAEGNLTMKGKRVDVLCSFSFTNTNEMKKTKIKPGIRFHGLSDEDKASKAERKEQKQAEREAKREAKKAAREARREERQQEKEARRQEKEAAREARAEEKAARAEEKAARKAAKKAARQARRDSLAALKNQ